MDQPLETRPSILKILTTKEGFNYCRKRWGKKFLIYFSIWFVTKWTLTIIFGKQIIEWFGGLFG